MALKSDKLNTNYRTTVEEDMYIEDCQDYRRFDVYELLEEGSMILLHSGITLDVIQDVYDISCEHLSSEMSDQKGDIHVSVFNVAVLILREV